MSKENTEESRKFFCDSDPNDFASAWASDTGRRVVIQSVDGERRTFTHHEPDKAIAFAEHIIKLANEVKDRQKTADLQSLCDELNAENPTLDGEACKWTVAEGGTHIWLRWSVNRTVAFVELNGTHSGIGVGKDLEPGATYPTQREAAFAVNAKLREYEAKREAELKAKEKPFVIEIFDRVYRWDGWNLRCYGPKDSVSVAWLEHYDGGGGYQSVVDMIISRSSPVLAELDGKHFDTEAEAKAAIESALLEAFPQDKDGIGLTPKQTLERLRREYPERTIWLGDDGVIHLWRANDKEPRLAFTCGREYVTHDPVGSSHPSQYLAAKAIIQKFESEGK